MKNAEMVKSLAKTGAEYILGQARLYPDNMLHVQVRCDKINRDYGLAFNAKLDNELREYFTNTEMAVNRSILVSMHHNSDAKYFPVQLKVVPDAETFHIQVAGPTFNRSYGWSGDLVEVQEIEFFLD